MISAGANTSNGNYGTITIGGKGETKIGDNASATLTLNSKLKLDGTTGQEGAVMKVGPNGTPVWDASLLALPEVGENYIPKMNASAIYESSMLYDDGAGHIGLGNQDPRCPLHISRSTQTSMPLQANGNRDNEMLRLSNVWNNANSDVTLTFDNNVNSNGTNMAWKLSGAVAGTGADQFRIRKVRTVYEQGQETLIYQNDLMTLDGTTGNVGIGAAPNTTNRLRVNGTIQAEGISLPGTHLVTATTATVNTIPKFTSTTGELGNSVLTENSGNIGIGVSTPTHPLSILKTSPTTGKNELMRLSNQTTIGGQNEPTLIFDNNFPSDHSSHYSWKFGASVYGGDYLRISRQYGSTSSGEESEYFRIKGNGYVGISNPSPLTKLHVGETMTFHDLATSTEIGRNWYYNGTQDSKIKTTEAGAGKIRISDNGRMDVFNAASGPVAYRPFTGYSQTECTYGRPHWFGEFKPNGPFARRRTSNPELPDG